jgi:ectoine hydroxylase-related dioxygenase (phytanoyl-CoA dioxygenase family)
MQEEPPRGNRAFSEQIRENGFAIVPEVLPPELVDDLVGGIAAALDNRGSESAHALRDLAQAVPSVKVVAEFAAVRALVESVLGPDAFLARSILFDKTPEANWKVAWHQDLTIAVRKKIEVPDFSAWSVKDGVVHVQPPVPLLERMLTVRLHLDDCDSANGPLQVIAGSHKGGRFNSRQISEWREQRQPGVCVVPRGGGLLMRPLLLHASSAAEAPRRRRVVHLEYAAESLPAGLEWHGFDVMASEA